MAPVSSAAPASSAAPVSRAAPASSTAPTTVPAAPSAATSATSPSAPPVAPPKAGTPPPLAAPPTRPGQLALSLQRVTLDNGLRVVMNVDHSSPNIAACVVYDVGSRNEVTGRSGFAHLFEHMMFQGSARVAKGEHFKLITARGGTLNGTTSTDRTNYFEMLPSSELALALFLEADRMKSLAVTPENVENQRAVVQEEYRMRVSNQAYAEGYIRLRSLSFEGYFPYSHDPIGSMADLDAAKFDDVAAFHAAYYAPDNAVLVIAGDFDADDAMNLVRQYFGDAKKRAAPPAYTPPPLPEQKERRSAEVTDTNARTPAVFIGWTIPPNRTPEHYALELASVVLGGGESSRLYQKLVRGDGKAQSVGVWTSDQRGPDLMVVRAILSDRAKVPELETSLLAEVARLAATGPTKDELERAKAEVAQGFVFGLESNLQRATQLGEFEAYYGDARLLSRELEFYRTITPEQVQAAVKQYLVKERINVVHVLPIAAKPDAKAVGAKPVATKPTDAKPAATKPAATPATTSTPKATP
jgi:predicted Zn-dependent peptidase